MTSPLDYLQQGTGYQCKVCGGPMEFMILTSHPPIHQWKCRCGRKVQERQALPPPILK